MSAELQMSESAKSKLYVETGVKAKWSYALSELLIPHVELTSEARAVLLEWGTRGDTVVIDEPYPATTEQWETVCSVARVQIDAAKAAEREKVNAFVEKVLANPASEPLFHWPKSEAVKPENLAYTAAYAAKKAAEDAENARRFAKEAASRESYRESERKREEAKAAEKARYERAKVRWIAQYGSERLKAAKKNGYSYNGLYVRERAAREYPGYVVDLQHNAKWDAIENPTLEHMKQAKEERAKLVWLLTPAQDTRPDYDDYEEIERGPALVIENYLGRYTLVKMLGG